MKKTLFYFYVLSFNLMSVSLQAEGFTLTSPNISGQLSINQVFDGFGCQGGNESPKLEWENAPQGTSSFAVTVYDPDAPTGSGWWHRVIFNIPKDVTVLKKNAGQGGSDLAPKGSIQSTTSFGSNEFGGACPPKGDSAHRYIFTVHALNVETLELDERATPALVGFYLNQHTLSKASLIAYYGH